MIDRYSDQERRGEGARSFSEPTNNFHKVIIKVVRMDLFVAYWLYVHQVHHHNVAPVSVASDFIWH